jgi:hypothetical protein
MSEVNKEQALLEALRNLGHTPGMAHKLATGLANPDGNFFLAWSQNNAVQVAMNTDAVFIIALADTMHDRIGTHIKSLALHE